MFSHDHQVESRTCVIHRTLGADKKEAKSTAMVAAHNCAIGSPYVFETHLPLEWITDPVPPFLSLPLSSTWGLVMPFKNDICRKTSNITCPYYSHVRPPSELEWSNTFPILYRGKSNKSRRALWTSKTVGICNGGGGKVPVNDFWTDFQSEGLFQHCQHEWLKERYHIPWYVAYLTPQSLRHSQSMLRELSSPWLFALALKP